MHFCVINLCNGSLTYTIFGSLIEHCKVNHFPSYCVSLSLCIIFLSFLCFYLTLFLSPLFLTLLFPLLLRIYLSAYHIFFSLSLSLFVSLSLSLSTFTISISFFLSYCIYMAFLSLFIKDSLLPSSNFIHFMLPTIVLI